jgi:hypothetical protein
MIPEQEAAWRDSMREMSTEQCRAVYVTACDKVAPFYAATGNERAVELLAQLRADLLGATAVEIEEGEPVILHVLALAFADIPTEGTA